MITAKPTSLTVRGRLTIGEDCAHYLIAEIGTNHNRDLETARALVRAVADGVFHCAKFQIYEPEEILSASVRAAD